MGNHTIRFRNKEGEIDKRYTITLEHCGHEKKRYVLRFCGEFINSHEKLDLARDAQDDHNNERLSNI